MRTILNFSIILFSIAAISFFNSSLFGFKNHTSSINKKYEVSYSEVKIKIELERSKLKNKSISKDSVSKIFTSNLIDKIFPHWYGTKWSFEGHTSIPNKGEIACGYFVSTTLKDIGFNLNRYKLAQQLPINEAHSLAVLDSVITIKYETSLLCKNRLYAILHDGLYFIGFDKSHVGFIYKTNKQLYIIDSNYFSGEVQKEAIEHSKVFNSFTTFYIAPLSTNEKLLKKWINKEEISVVTSYK